MNKTGKWARRSVWATLVAVLTIGCNPLTTIGFLLHRDTKIPAEYPLRPKEGPKKDKDEEITVLVICGQRQTGGIPFEFAGIDRELATTIAKRMPEEAKANKEKVAVVSPSKFDKFKIDNPHWRTMRPDQIGKRLGADYVLDVTLSNIQVYQPGSRNMLYEGRAEVWVEVYDLLNTTAEQQHYAHQFAYQPPHTPDATDSTGINLSVYKQGFVERLAMEIIWKHLEHKPADGIAAAR
jgi:hypothetical protein